MSTIEMDDQNKINTEAGLIYTYLKARFDVDEYAGPLMWLIRTQLPKADILDGERVKTIMNTVKNCVGYPMWFTAHLMFQSALVLIIFDHYKALHLKDVAELIAKYPQFSSLSTDEQKQLLKFRNLLVVAVKIFDPRENPVDVLSLMESICGHTSSSCTTVKKRLHREQIFLRETGIAAEYRRKKPRAKDNQISHESSLPKPVNSLSQPIVRNISDMSSISHKRPVEPSPVILAVAAKKKRVESALVVDEVSTRELCASAAEGAYDILRQYCAYSSSSDNSDDDDDCDTNDDEDSNLDQEEEEEEEEEDEEGSLQSVSEEEVEIEGSGVTEGAGKADGAESLKGRTASRPVATASADADAASRNLGGSDAKLDAGSSNSNTSTSTGTSSALNSIIDTANELANRNRRPKTLAGPRRKENAEQKNSNASDRSTLKASNTMHQNNVRIAAENVLRAVTTAAICGPMHEVLNAHMGCYEQPPAPVYSTPSTYNMYSLPPFPPLDSYHPNGPGLTFNPAQYQYNSTQPGGGLYSAYSAQYAVANNNNGKQLYAPPLAPLPMSMSSASSYPYSNPYSHPATAYQQSISYPSLSGTHQFAEGNANSNSSLVYNSHFPHYPGAFPPAPPPAAMQAACASAKPQLTGINAQTVPYCSYPHTIYSYAPSASYPTTTSSTPVVVPIASGTTVNSVAVQPGPGK